MSDIILSKEELRTLMDVQCNFHGKNPTTQQVTTLEYLEDQKLVERNTQNHRTCWKLTVDGSRVLHCAIAKKEEERKKLRQKWCISIIVAIITGFFTFAAALFSL